MFWSRQFPAYVLGEAECFPNKVLYSDTPPRASTLYPFIIIHHFWQKWYLFHIPSIDKCDPFHILSLEHFNLCKCTILLICINNKTRKLSHPFTAIKYICWPFLSFHRAKWQIFLHQLMKSLPSRISEAWKRYTFRQSSGIDHYREYPLEGLMSTLVPFSGRQWWLCVFFKTYKQNNHTD